MSGQKSLEGLKTTRRELLEGMKEISSPMSDRLSGNSMILVLKGKVEKIWLMARHDVAFFASSFFNKTSIPCYITLLQALFPWEPVVGNQDLNCSISYQFLSYF